MARFDGTPVNKPTPRFGSTKASPRFGGTPAEPEEVTAKGVVEVAGNMGLGMIGALGGTIAGVSEAVREGDPFAYTGAFESVMQSTNEVLHEFAGLDRESMSGGGRAAMDAVEGFYKEYIQDTGDDWGDALFEATGSEFLGAFGKTAPEAMAMAVPFAVKPIATLAGRGLKSVGKTAKTAASKRAIRRAERVGELDSMVDVKTGEPAARVNFPLSDKGTSMKALAEGVRHAGRGEFSEAMHSMILKPAFFKPVEVWRSHGSPALTKMADQIFRPTRADKSRGFIGDDLISATNRAQAKYLKVFDDIYKPLNSRLRNVNKGASQEIVRGLRTGKTPEKYAPYVAEIQEALRVIHDGYTKKIFKDAGTVDNYLAQVWDVASIEKRPAEFSSFLRKTFKMSHEAAEKVVRRIRENDGMMGFDDAIDRLGPGVDAKAWSQRVMDPGRASKNPHIEMSRKLNIPEGALPAAEKWLVNDLEPLLTQYVRGVTRRVEYARVMGRSEGKLNRVMAKAIDELGIGDSSTKISQLSKDVYGLADALQGKYKMIENPALAKLNRRVANYETMLHLGLVSLASIPELAAPAIQFGFVPKAYANGALYSLRMASRTAERLLRGRASKIGKGRIAEALEQQGLISMNTIQSTTATRFNNVSSMATNKFMHMTGLEALTDMQRVIAYSTLESVIKKAAKGKGRANKGLLRELGIEEKVFKKWVDDGMPSVGPLADIIENAKARGVNWAITMPNAATKPLLFSDPHFTNILLFKSFTSVFSNLFMKRAMSELGMVRGVAGSSAARKLSIASSMTASVALAYYTQFVREWLAGYDSDREPSSRLLAAVDRSALFGPFTYAYQIADPYRYGFADDSKNRIFNLFGAAFGDAAKVADLAINADMSDKKRAKTVVDMMPGVNVFGAIEQPARDVVEDIID